MANDPTIPTDYQPDGRKPIPIEDQANARAYLISALSAYRMMAEDDEEFQPFYLSCKNMIHFADVKLAKDWLDNPS